MSPFALEFFAALANALLGGILIGLSFAFLLQRPKKGRME